MDRIIVALVALVALSSVLAAEAAAQDFSEGVRAAGMGDAFTAVATGTSAIYHNPAGAARVPMYSLDAGYEYTPDGNVLSASILDSKTNSSLAAGIGYGYYFGRGENDVRGHDFRLALALPVVPDKISIGLGGRYLLMKDTEILPDEKDGEPVPTDVQLMNGPTVDAGILFRASKSLHLGVAAQNLVDQCKKAACRTIAPTIISGGAALGLDLGLTLSADVGVDLTTGDQPAPDIGVGAEYVIARVVPARLGYHYRGGVVQHLLTVGLGWTSSSAGVDVGYQLDLQDTSRMYFMGSFSVYL